MNNPVRLAAALGVSLVLGWGVVPSSMGSEPALRRPSPPGQRVSGPGGADYAHGSWRQTMVGAGATACWLFEPADPVPTEAPLVVFMHGWAALDPWLYGAWIEHLLRRGNVVLFPRYQTTLLSNPPGFYASTVQALRDVLRQAGQGDHVKLKPGQVAYVGHSMGAVLSANLAAGAAREGLPPPKALMCVQPGGTRRTPDSIGLDLHDLRTIPIGMLLLSVAGDRDAVVGDLDAVRIYQGAGHLPEADRNLVYFLTDERGSPPLRGNHYAPCSPPSDFCNSPGEPPPGSFPTQLKAALGVALGDYSPLRWLLQTPHGREWMHSRLHCPVYAETFYAPDATDFDHWRLFDALCEAAFTGRNRDQALGNTAAQRDRGQWSDGTPVKELRVITGNVVRLPFKVK